jgi:formylglycine-generating enzyme required for sulfatase activity
LGWRAGLPSEAEWEKAARGGLQVPAAPVLGVLGALATGPEFVLRDNPRPLSRYPWGHQPDPDCANYIETGIKATTAPGAFARGASQYGCHDMSGNVWEWCMNQGLQDYGQYQEPDKTANEYLAGLESRVIRGGPYWSSHQDVRAAFRDLNEPGLFNSFIGLRVVARPHPL